MNWLNLLEAAGAAGLVGIFVGFICSRSAFRQKLEMNNVHLGNRLRADQDLYFAALRRELANFMIERDHDQFYQISLMILDEVNDLATASDEHKDAQLQLISDAYPSIGDFDQMKTKDHVLYGDALLGLWFDDVAKTYRDIIVYQTIMRQAKHSIHASPPISQESIDHLRAYIQNIKASREKFRIASAHQETESFEAFVSPMLENDEFRVHWYNTIEREYGSRIRYKTNEFRSFYVPHKFEMVSGFAFDDGSCGVTTFFAGDGDEFFVGIKRSDLTFEDFEYLDDLPADRISVPYGRSDKELLGYKTP